MEGKHEAARAPRKNHRRSGAGMTALKVLGTLLAIGVCTALMFFGIFMKYVHLYEKNWISLECFFIYIQKLKNYRTYSIIFLAYVHNTFDFTIFIA